jgi:membrane peptidoglycan carboxypeptidase
MTSVHGISVAGGTFPATIWKLFMEQALDSTPESDFPEARSEPVWHTFTRGQYAGEVYEPPTYVAPSESTTTTKQREKTTPPPPPPEPVPPPPPPEPVPPPPPPISPPPSPPPPP